MIKDLEETINEIKKDFEINIRCKNCGSDNVFYHIGNEYDGEEEWMGQSIHIRCNDCEKFFID